MHERSRYRVSGSLFLVALAVIFLPMLFDGSGAPVGTMPATPSVSELPIDTVPVYEEIVPVTDVVERVISLRGEVDADGFEMSTGTHFGEPRLSAENEDTQVWAVQAGSFSQRQNALDFRQQIRKAGYEAFLSSAKDVGGNSSAAPVYRVAIGPLLSRQDANTISAEITQQFDIEPRIVEMIP